MARIGCPATSSHVSVPSGVQTAHRLRRWRAQHERGMSNGALCRPSGRAPLEQVWAASRGAQPRVKVLGQQGAIEGLVAAGTGV